MMAPLSSFCNECGAANTYPATHCFACNEPLDQAPPSSSVQPFSQSSAQYPSQLSAMQFSSPTLSAVSPVRTSALAVSPGPGVLLKQRYKIVREIGQGGFGVVYLAEDGKRKGKLVAVKQINIGKLNVRESIDATDSYNREVSLLPKLRHKRLPRFYDHFTDPEHWYLVLDYIEGQTLEEYLETVPDKSLPIKKALDIGIQVCDVLNYLHIQSPPIIFRDVKPANLMYTRKGKVYLIDFGIARRFVPGKAKDTGPLGSPGYAAPEQYGLAQTSRHTDVYGLGATLQTLITGKEPLDHATGGPSRPYTKRRYRKLYRLLDQMLEKDGRKRPKTIQHVRAHLEFLRYGFWRPYLQGILLSFAPYALIMAMHTGVLNPGMGVLFGLLYTISCLWPLIFASQAITAIIMLFMPRKRLAGLGILTTLMLLILGLMLLPSLVFFSPYPPDYCC
ncbi:MAG TPA: serine/threonine-protein kinase [Ktedonosporobacter sp.]|nr:serine/threonine-protein kinase [Ktedonosporobacter sp.]